MIRSTFFVFVWSIASRLLPHLTPPLPLLSIQSYSYSAQLRDHVAAGGDDDDDDTVVLAARMTIHNTTIPQGGINVQSFSIIL